MNYEKLTTNDKQFIAYQHTTGFNPGVLFLSGFKSDMTGIKAKMLGRWCQQRGQAFTCFDYYGHGTSSGEFEQGTIGRWRDDAIYVLDEVTHGPQIIVGSSMGGWIMLLLGLARPERIVGMVGIASAADFTETLIWKNMTDETRAKIQQEGKIYRPSHYDDQPYPITYQLMEEGRNHLLLDKSINLECPIRLLHGMRDPDVPWQLSLRISECLRSEDVRIQLIKDGNHRLSRDVDLDLLTASIEELSH